MGEKLCMRTVLKEVQKTMECLNEDLCKQAVQQDMILQDDTPSH